MYTYKVAFVYYFLLTFVPKFNYYYNVKCQTLKIGGNYDFQFVFK